MPVLRSWQPVEKRNLDALVRVFSSGIRTDEGVHPTAFNGLLAEGNRDGLRFGVMLEHRFTVFAALPDILKSHIRDRT